MKKKKLKILSFLVAGLAVTTAAAIAFQVIAGVASVKKFECESTNPAQKEQDFDSADLTVFPDSATEIDGYERVAETGTMALFLRKDNAAVKLYDKRTQKVWSSMPDEKVIADSANSDATKNRMRSLFTFQYVDLSNIRAGKKETTLYDAAPLIKRERIKNGVALAFTLEKFSISFKLDFTLIDDELYCEIQDKDIFENEDIADQISEKKEDIQKRINNFQNLADQFKGQLESSNFDPTVVSVVKLFSNEIFNIMVKAKETAGTDSFQPSQFRTIQDDISEIKSRLDKSADTLQQTLSKMKEQIDIILQLTNELSTKKAVGITELDLMPYFGAGKFGEDGYAFYPDGSGAISRFDKLHSVASGVFKQDIYDSFSPADKQKKLDSYNTENVRPSLYPVFGVKISNSAFSAVISKGDTDAAIFFNPITSSNAFGNVYGSLHFRQMTSGNNQTGDSFSVYDKKRTKQDWKITYKFLANEKANYSGMANFYQEYLLRSNLLARSPLMDKSMPLTSEFVMGIEPPQNNLLRNYIKLTSFRDVEDYADKLHQEGVSSLMVNISDWLEHDGKVTKQPQRPAPELGTKQDLSRLTSYFRKNGYVLSLEKSFAEFDKQDIPMLERSNATAKALNGISLDIKDGDYEEMFMNPFYVYQTHMQDLKLFGKYGNNAVTYDDVSDNLYYDYNKSGSANRRKTADVFNKLMADSKQTVPYNVQANSSALYLNQTDWNIHMAPASSGYIFTDQDVPFYQMVFHGFFPYTSSPLNEASDIDKAKLQRLELGEVPYYRLTSELPSEIKLWFNTGLYSPRVSKWYPTILEDYREYSAEYGSLWNKRILSHEELATDVFRVCYEGGTEVLVNYSQQDYPYREKIVPQKGSIILENGERE